MKIYFCQNEMKGDEMWAVCSRKVKKTDKCIWRADWGKGRRWYQEWFETEDGERYILVKQYK